MRRVFAQPITTFILITLTLLALFAAAEHNPTTRRALVHPGIDIPGAGGPRDTAFTFLYRTPDAHLFLSADPRLEAWPDFSNFTPLGQTTLAWNPKTRDVTLELPNNLSTNDIARARTLVADEYFTTDRYGTQPTDAMRDSLITTGSFTVHGWAPPTNAFLAGPPILVLTAALGTLALISLILFTLNRFRGTHALITNPVFHLTLVVLLTVDLYNLGYDARFATISTTIANPIGKQIKRSMRISFHFDDFLVVERPDGSPLVLDTWRHILGWRPEIDPANDPLATVFPRFLGVGFYAPTRNEIRFQFRFFPIGRSLTPTQAAQHTTAALQHYREHYFNAQDITDAHIRNAASTPANSSTTIVLPTGPRPVGYVRNACVAAILLALIIALPLTTHRTWDAVRPAYD